MLSFCDWALLGRQLPTRRSWAALTALLLSSAGYAYFDRGFVVNAYVWLFIWYVFFTFEGVWVKHMVSVALQPPESYVAHVSAVSQSAASRASKAPARSSGQPSVSLHVPRTHPPTPSPAARARLRSATPSRWATGRAYTTPT